MDHATSRVPTCFLLRALSLPCSRARLLQAKERLRIATEKLYQQEVDAEILLEQMKVDMTVQMDE